VHAFLRAPLVLASIAACAGQDPGPTTAERAATLTPGTYQVRVAQARFLRPRHTAIEGLLVLTDTVLPTKGGDWVNRPANGCLNLRGDLGTIALSRLRVAVPDSIAGFTTWKRDSTGHLRLPVYQGIDDGYELTFTIDENGLSGVGRHHGMGGGGHETRWTGERVGGPDTRKCVAAFRKDSIWWSRHPH